MVSRSNIAERVMQAEWLVQFAENWAGLPAGVIKRQSRMANVNEIRRMVIAYAYWKIGLSQQQTGALVNRNHSSIHHQLMIHNEAHELVGNTNRHLDSSYVRNYKLFCDDVEYNSKINDVKYLQTEIARLQKLLKKLQNETK